MLPLGLEISASLSVPFSELKFSFVRSSGPGGQNVNKVNSKAVLRWNLLQSPSLNEEWRQRLLLKLASKLSKEGELMIASDTHRDQGQNKEACLLKLKRMLAQAILIPKKRKKTKPSYSSKLRAESSKKRHSLKKKLRGGRDSD